MTAALQSAADFDQAKADAFAERFMEIFNAGAICLMTSIGHRAGLFDAMAAHGPGTSQQIADHAGLDERYVREWLGAMVAGAIASFDPATGTYALPAEHAANLTRSAPANMAVIAQFVPVLAQVEDDVLDCFRSGGGVPYSRYPRFHEVMAEESGQTVLPALNEHILPLVPGLTERLAQGIDVLDCGCGRGKALMQMAEEYPASRFIGYDLSAEAVAWARAEAARRGLANVTFVQRDLSTFDQDAEPGRFDLVTTFDAIHDQARPRAMLAGIRRSLRDGGVYLAQDINGSACVHCNLDHPIGPFIYTISCLHCMTVSLAQGGEGLGAMWGKETALDYLRDAGFAEVTASELPHDIQNVYYVARAA